MLRIALPNKGGLADEAVLLVQEAGYRCRREGRELLARDASSEVEFFFLRPRDIAIYVGSGDLDLGITGRDLARDGDGGCVELLALGFGHSRFFYAVPRDLEITPEDFGGLRVATSYARLVKDDLSSRDVDAQIVRLDGAVEIAVRMGVADVIADVVQSGRTLEQAGLKTVGAPLLESEAVLLGRTLKSVDNEEIRTMVERLRGIVVAREYAMVEYDVPRSLMDAACAITPGIEAPTVAPLSNKDWVAIKAMVARRDANRIMDRLKELGARGIIVTDIRACRI